MKKIYYFLMLCLSFSLTKAQKSVNFTAKDCNGNTHDLFANLDSGKVVVIDWVMPCGTCIAPSKTTYNVVHSLDTIFPGKIEMFVVDDYANTACPSVVSWTDNNGMPNTIKFSDASIKMSDYGSAGMPKVIITAGKDHVVFFNENGTNISNITKLQTALSAAIASTYLSVDEFSKNQYKIEILPNPSSDKFTIKLNQKNNNKLSICLTDIAGKIVKSIIENETIAAGEKDIEVITNELSNGVYFIKFYDSKISKTYKIVVNH